MSFNKSFLSLLTVLLFIFSCDKKEQKPDFPVLFTGQVTEVSKDGAVFSASFKNLDSDRLLDFGFIWGTNENLTIDSPYKYSLSYAPNKESYSYKNTSSLQSDVVYYVMSYVKYGNTVYYGKAVSFFSMGSTPYKILSVTPSNAWFSDTVRIKFDNIIPTTAPRSITFNNELSRIVGTKDSTILVIVPELSINNSYFKDGITTIHLQQFSIQSNAFTGFSINPAVIDSFSPADVQTFNFLSIYGKGFIPKSTSVYIGNTKCTTTTIDSRKIVCRAPISFEDFEDSLKLNTYGKTISSGTIKIVAPRIEKHFPDSMFSYENMSFMGKSLGNAQLVININNQPANILYRSDDSIVVEVVGNLCGKGAAIDMRIENSYKNYKELFPLFKPANIEIIPDNKEYFNGNLTIKGNYFPNVIAEIYYNNLYSHSVYIAFNKKSKSEFTINIDEELSYSKGWLNLKAIFCNSTEIKLDSAFFVPAPVITFDPTIYNFSIDTIRGMNFNQFARKNIIYIDNYVFDTKTAENDSTIIFTPHNITTDVTHSLRVGTNGQLSNQVNFTIHNRWKKVSDFPIYLGYSPKGFILGDILNVSSTDFNGTMYFGSYNLTTKEWKKYTSMPVWSGAYVTDSTYGYLFNENNLYRYDQQTHIWELLSTISFPIAQNNPLFVNSFYYSGKLYFFSECSMREIYKYDISTGEWSKISLLLPPDFCYTRLSVALFEDKAYLLNGQNYIIFDLATEQTSENKNLPFTGDYIYKSLNGFVYNREIYFYEFNRFMKFNPDRNMEFKAISGPGYGSGNCILQKGTKAYLIVYDGIWELDLTMGD